MYLCYSDNVRLAFAASIARGSMSMPMNLRFNRSAAIAVVPAPQNGSKTVWPSSVSPFDDMRRFLRTLFPFMQGFIGQLRNDRVVHVICDFIFFPFTFYKPQKRLPVSYHISIPYSILMST